MVMAQMAFLVSLSLVYATKFEFKNLVPAIGTFIIFLFAIAPRSITFPGPVILKLLLVRHYVRHNIGD